jgi:hypothetical protein
LDTAAIDFTCAQINAYVPVWGLHRSISESEVCEIVSDAYAAESLEYTIRSAQSWADGYVFPPDLVASNFEEFASAGSLQALAEKRHKERYDDRLNIESVYATLGEDGLKIPGVSAEDFQHLRELATGGIELILPPKFEPNLAPPPLRNKYIKVSNAVHKLIAVQVLNGTVVLVPASEAVGIAGIHFSCQHWTECKGKIQGRIICDTTNPADPLETPLNGSARAGKAILRELVRNKWGDIKHPTLAMVANMILDAAEKVGWDNIVLWKMDLKGAFNLLWFRACCTQLLAFPLTNDLVAIHLAGIFGWVGMPFVFQVITRVVSALVAFLILGWVLMYVNDVIGVSTRDNVDSDMLKCKTGVCSLMGRYAIADNKSEKGRILDNMLGWLVNLETRAVTVSKRNLLKTIYVFFSFDIEGKLNLKQIERLASLASRISQLSRAMRPFTTALYALAKVDVCIWRAYLVMSKADPDNLCRPLSSFRKRSETLGFGYDASLHTLAVGVSLLCAITGEQTLLGYTVIRLPFRATTDAGFQNTYEYMAVLVGVLVCLSLGIRSRSCCIWGDSISSLSWSMRDRANSSLSRRTNIAFTLAAAYADIDITDTVHVPGKKNVRYDGLTRGKTASQVGLAPNLEIVFPQSHPVYDIVRLCDPQESFLSGKEHSFMAREIVRLLQNSVFSANPPTPPFTS